MNSEGSNQTDLKYAPLREPHWHALFCLLGGLILLVIGVSVRFITGLSSADDRVFALEALISGIIADFLIRKLWHRRLIFLKSFPVPFVAGWFLLCLYVFVFRPFE